MLGHFNEMKNSSVFSVAFNSCLDISIENSSVFSSVGGKLERTGTLGLFDAI
jgi:hypothetical protein